MQKPTITMSNEFHQNNPVIRLVFEKDFALIGKVKHINGATWSQSRGFWYIVHTTLAKIKSPLDRFFENNANDINMLQK